MFMSLGVLTFVMLLGNTVKIADMVINKGVNIFSVSKLFLFMMPYLLTYTLPIAILVAVLLSLGRLSNDNEILAIRASGINMFSLVIPLLIVSLILSLVMVVFNDRVIPYARYATKKTMIEVGVKSPTAALEPGVFINAFQKYIVFIYSIDQNKLNNIRIYEPQGEDKPARTIIAKKGEFIALPEKSMIKLKLIDGTSDEPDPNNPTNFYKLNFKTYFMSLNMAQAGGKKGIQKKTKDMTIEELLAEARRLKKEGVNPTPISVEIHKKIALAFSCFVFMLLGASLAMVTRRREKSINFGMAFIITGAYYVLLLGSEALALEGYLNAGVAMWLPNIIFTLIGTILTLKVCAY